MINPQRLRDLSATLDCEGSRLPGDAAQLCRQAADELERLRAGLRLAIARWRGIPFDDLTQGDLDSWCDAAQRSIERATPTQAAKGASDGSANQGTL